MLGGLRRRMARSRDHKVKGAAGAAGGVASKNENATVVAGTARVVENIHVQHGAGEMADKKRRVFDDAENAVNAAGGKRPRCKGTSGQASDIIHATGKSRIPSLSNSTVTDQSSCKDGARTTMAKSQEAAAARKQANRSRILRNSENIDPREVSAAPTECEKPAVRFRAAAKSRLPTKKTVSKKEPFEVQPPKMLPPHLKKSNAELRKVTTGMQELLRKPPVGIESEGHRDQLASGKYAVYIVSYLQSREWKYVLDPHFLKQSKEITPCMRSVLVDWLIKVQNHLRLNQDTLHQAVTMLDQFTTLQHISLTNYQLLGISCLFISTKVNERFPPTIEKLVKLTDDTYKESQVIRMEREVLKTLKFDATPVTAVYFTYRLCHLLGDNVHPMFVPLCEYLLDLTLVDVNMVQCLASMKAAAVVRLALEIVQSDSENLDAGAVVGWTPALRYFSTYGAVELEKATRRLAKLLLKADKSKYTGPYEKYSSSAMFLSVAEWSHLSGSVVQDLARDPTPPTVQGSQASSSSLESRKIQVITTAHRPPAGQIQIDGEVLVKGK